MLHDFHVSPFLSAIIRLSVNFTHANTTVDDCQEKRNLFTYCCNNYIPNNTSANGTLIFPDILEFDIFYIIMK